MSLLDISNMTPQQMGIKLHAKLEEQITLLLMLRVLLLTLHQPSFKDLRNGLNYQIALELLVKYNCMILILE